MMKKASLTSERRRRFFDDYMVSLPLDQRRILAVILMESIKSRQKMNVRDAAREAGSIVGFNEKTVRRHTEMTSSATKAT